MTDEELQEMIDEADRDGDGEINEEEVRTTPQPFPLTTPPLLTTLTTLHHTHHSHHSPSSLPTLCLLLQFLRIMKKTSLY